MAEIQQQDITEVLVDMVRELRKNSCLMGSYEAESIHRAIISIRMNRMHVEAANKRIDKLCAFAKAHEAWEGMVLNDDGPGIDRMPEDVRDKFDEVQMLRVKALA